MCSALVISKIFGLVPCTALFVYAKMLQELVCLEMVVTATTEMMVSTFGSVLYELQFVYKRW